MKTPVPTPFQQGGLFSVMTLVILTLLLQSCQGRATPAPLPPATPESATLFAKAPEVTDALAATLRAQLRPTWDYATYQEYDTVDNRQIGEWSTFLVSSGVFDTAEMPLPTGETVAVDVVYAYQTAPTGKTLTLPVAVGLQTEEAYVYFSPYAAYARMSGDELSFTTLTRAEALADAQSRLPEGQLFTLTLAEYVTATGFVWADCPAFAARMQIPGAYCTLGEQLDAQHPQQTRYLTMRILTDVPPTWLVFGFWFFEMETPDA
ncbi:MAG: hypothetical protein HUU38_01710 [Anaerolineales bacterium]|nr:hypothetical protein [Anaerolineales bacterium]